MQILQIGDRWPSQSAGGLNSYFYEMYRHLPACGVQVRGYVVGSPEVAQETAQQIQAFASPSDSLRVRSAALRRAVKQELRSSRVDVLASHFALYAAPILDLLKWTPSVVHFHGPWFAESAVEAPASLAARAKHLVERSVYARGRRFIVLSEAFQQELHHGFGVPADKIRVVPGGVDIDRFNLLSSRQHARQQLGWPLDRPILLSIRRQVRRMGLEQLIEAVDLVRAHHPDLLVLLGGTGALGPELDQRIRERDLEGHVRRLGRVSEEELPLCYRAADFTVVPSQALEGFGLITLESLACGTPVLVTPVGGLPEVLQPFAPQLILKDRSAVEIANGIKAVLGGQLQLPSEQACRNYCVQQYAWPRIAEQVCGVYREAIAS